ncbi:hypothetical protein QT381_05200 [Galbitalea sp. SE-J8]|uniref:hypothetical protein n=1 Tax=Galbitalea sp. SE-J8 TaxID=3054952 RepID=UPI00259CD9F2|nr:hypothetical protein [Galbitalea sp. SE-J8]MDM4762401.1 hypothetical protein [Galbitalea sp. SE-J8]
MKPDVTSIIGFSTRRGRALLGFYGALTAVVAVLTLPGTISPVPALLALALVLAGLVVLTLPGREPFAWRMTLPVVGIVIVVTALCSWNLRHPADPGYADWNLGATTLLLLVLALRGRRLVAWIALAAVAVVLVTASVTLGEAVAGALYTSARQAATLLVGTLFAILLRRTAHAIGAIQRRALVHASRDAATAARVAERAAQNARLERDARPALERLLADAPLVPEELEAFALLEGSLRDGIDAAAPADDPLAEAIRAARRAR